MKIYYKPMIIDNCWDVIKFEWYGTDVQEEQRIKIVQVQAILK